MIPPMFIGFFIAAVIRGSAFFRYLSLPTVRLASAANLPTECSTALTLFLVNSWTALAVLSEMHKKTKTINNNELIITVLVGSIPKIINSTIFYFAPVAISVLGLYAGGLYLCLDISANLFVALIGIFFGRLMLTGNASKPVEDYKQDSEKINITKIKNGLKESLHSSVRIVKILIPTVFITQLIANYLLVKPIIQEYSSVLGSIGFPSSSLIVLFASLVSQSAAIVSSGTLLNGGEVSIKACLMLLFIARILHLGIGFLKGDIPINVSYFGGKIGLKVAVYQYVLIAIAYSLVILFIYIHL
jgi:hypothetical protein